VEPAQKKKAVTPTTVAAPALAPVVAPVVESLSKRSKDSGIVVVAGCAHVVSVAPSVDTAPQKQANVATAVNAPDEDDSEDRSEKESEDAGNEDNLEDKSDESDELLDEDEKTKDEGVHYDVAVQGGIAHGNMGQLVVSFRCIYILFCISYIVM
jgi:hypothetical protein